MTDATASQGDGRNRLFGDSRLGLIVSYVTGVALTFGVAELAKVDLSSKRGWWVPFLALAISNGGGALAAYKAKREKARAAKSGSTWNG
jgi:hypothetical protein